jgi:D-3-phosphoglycerate dehydrogenase
MGQPSVYVALSEFCKHEETARRVLTEAGFGVREMPMGRRLKREEMFEALREADAVLAGLEPYDGELLKALPRLRCISRCGVGTDAIDLKAARHLNIAVLTTPEEVVEPVAQMTVAMILALARNFPLYCAARGSGSWRRHAGYLLSEWTIGLVGLGRVGRAVASYLQKFGPRLLAADPYVKASAAPEGVKLCGLEDLLTQADLVSLHAARRPEEGPLLSRVEIAAMKPDSRLVNTARGYLVDETALLDALRSGHLSGAALDVFQTEPYSGPLADLPQVLCSPHVSTLTKASRAAMELRCAENVVAFFSRASSGA